MFILQGSSLKKCKLFLGADEGCPKFVKIFCFIVEAPVSNSY